MFHISQLLSEGEIESLPAMELIHARPARENESWFVGKIEFRFFDLILNCGFQQRRFGGFSFGLDSRTTLWGLDPKLAARKPSSFVGPEFYKTAIKEADSFEDLSAAQFFEERLERTLADPLERVVAASSLDVLLLDFATWIMNRASDETDPRREEVAFKEYGQRAVEEHSKLFEDQWRAIVENALSESRHLSGFGAPVPERFR